VTRPVGRLLHLGNVVVDVVLTVPGLPERGGDVLASTTAATPGGGFNVMAAAARQGLPVAYGGILGTGPFADLAAAGLTAEGIEILQPRRPGLDTGVVISLVDGDGERTFVTGPGAEARLTAQDLAQVRAGPADAVYVSGYGLLHASNRPALLGWLANLDPASSVFFDPGPLAAQIPPSALAAVVGRADWLSCNAREATILTGRHDAATAARALARRPTMIVGDPGPPATQIPHDHENLRPPAGVVVRTGADGCLIVPPGAAELIQVPGFRVDTVDTNGAGDTHTGVFIAALARGAEPAQAARQANAAAALSVTRIGPATAPTAAELARFLAGS
jgi:sugar/nucleoside kinase (ribokinase family)